ncbi:MAG: TadE/TadG family type IV pilus assembly protein [Microthrixaceae bacterium]
MRSRGRHERGAVLVEMVLITPLLLGLVMAVFDLGMGWKTSMTVSSASRAGARIASNLGKDDGADQNTLASIAAAMGSVPAADFDTVVIYRSTAAGGDPPAGCLTAVAKSVGGDAGLQCNVYSGSEAATAASSGAFTGDCSARRDRFWCPPNRANSQSILAGPDYVGVYIAVRHSTFTKLFGSTIDIDDHAVMRIEPNAGN